MVFSSDLNVEERNLLFQSVPDKEYSVADLADSPEHCVALGCLVSRDFMIQGYTTYRLSARGVRERAAILREVS